MLGLLLGLTQNHASGVALSLPYLKYCLRRRALLAQFCVSPNYDRLHRYKMFAAPVQIGAHLIVSPKNIVTKKMVLITAQCVPETAY